ncbi:MAG: hypothetical protein Kow0069_15610 [Promethearchaeota archaeon]
MDAGGKRELVRFVFLYVASRALLLLIPGNAVEVREFALWGDVILRGENPYETYNLELQGYFAVKYPPLFYAFCAAIVALFGHSSASFKLAILLFEVPTLVAMRACSALISHKGGAGAPTGDLETLRPASPPNARERKPALALYVYCFSPITVVIWLYGYLFAIPVLFLTLGVYAFYAEKWGLLGFSLSVGFLTELFPAFFFVPVLAFLARQKRWGEVIRSVLAFLVTFAGFSFPFLLLSPQVFLHNFLVHFARVPQAVSFWAIVQSATPWPSVRLFDVVTVGYVGATFLAFFISYAAFSWWFFGKEENRDKRNVVYATVAFFLFQHVVFLSLFMRYSFWGFAAGLLFVESQENEAHAAALSGFTTVAVAAFAAYGLARLSSFAFSDLTAMELAEGDSWVLVNYHHLLAAVLAVPWIVWGNGVKLEGQETTRLSLVRLTSLTLLGFVVQVCVIPTPVDYLTRWVWLVKWLVTFALVGFLAFQKSVNVLVHALGKDERFAPREFGAFRWGDPT